MSVSVGAHPTHFALVPPWTLCWSWRSPPFQSKAVCCGIEAVAVFHIAKPLEKGYLSEMQQNHLSLEKRPCYFLLEYFANCVPSLMNMERKRNNFLVSADVCCASPGTQSVMKP